MTTIFYCPGVMVRWSKFYDYDRGQNFKITVVKWSKLVIFDHGHGHNLRISVVKWSKFVNFDHGPWDKFQDVMVMISALPPLPIFKITLNIQ